MYATVSLLAVAKQKNKLRVFKKHLGKDNPDIHGTDKCEYCNEFARDCGLLTANVVNVIL